MGYESNQCSFAPLITSKIILQCPYGNITNLYIDRGVGINAYNLSDDLKDEEYGKRGACIKDDKF